MEATLSAMHPTRFGSMPNLRAEKIIEVVAQMSHGATNKALARALDLDQDKVMLLTGCMFLAGQLNRHTTDVLPVRYYLP